MINRRYYYVIIIIFFIIFFLFEQRKIELFYDSLFLIVNLGLFYQLTLLPRLPKRHITYIRNSPEAGFIILTLLMGFYFFTYFNKTESTIIFIGMLLVNMTLIALYMYRDNKFSKWPKLDTSTAEAQETIERNRIKSPGNIIIMLVIAIIMLLAVAVYVKCNSVVIFSVDNCINILW